MINTIGSKNMERGRYGKETAICESKESNESNDVAFVAFDATDSFKGILFPISYHFLFPG
jgi:hypothetical protein